jgi:hypothetical protein
MMNIFFIILLMTCNALMSDNIDSTIGAAALNVSPANTATYVPKTPGGSLPADPLCTMSGQVCKPTN